MNATTQVVRHAGPEQPPRRAAQGRQVEPGAGARGWAGVALKGQYTNTKSARRVFSLSADGVLSLSDGPVNMRLPRGHGLSFSAEELGHVHLAATIGYPVTSCGPL